MDFENLKKNHPKSFELLNQLEFCVIDLETTGGNHQFDKIIEIGLVKIKHLKITESLNFLIDPEIEVPEFIQRLTSIRSEDLVGKPKIEETIDDLMGFIGDAVLVAHNSSFDVPFLNSVLKRLGRSELKNKAICTNLMTKFLIPDILNSNLTYMSQIFKIQHSKAHRALEDAKACASLFLTYLEFFIEKDIRKINQLYYPRNKYELDRIHFKKDESSKEDIYRKIQSVPGNFLVQIKGANGVVLAVFPYIGNENDKAFLEKLLSRPDWEMVTFKLVGSFIELFLQFNEYYGKCDQEFKTDMLQHLFTSYLKEEKVRVDFHEDETPFYEQYDYLMAPHLIPKQVIVFPLMSLFNKSHLIFRYPAHKKKLIQYINSSWKRFEMGAKSVRKNSIHRNLRVFLHLYLKSEDQSDETLYYLFKHKQFKDNSKTFWKEFDAFLKTRKNKIYYPVDHL